MWSTRIRCKNETGFSLIELMVVLITASVMTASIMSYFFQQQRMFRGQKIKADAENLGLIGFFKIGRDIRGAGCMTGVVNGGAAVPAAVSLAEHHKISVLCDRNGDGDVDDQGEQITYEFDSGKSRLMRYESGSPDIAIDNISTFDISYRLRGNGLVWHDSVTVDRPLIKLVWVTVGVGGNVMNTATGKAMKERLYSTSFRIMNLQ